jgi:CxxC-x17-CxxC domain-containing protein
MLYLQSPVACFVAENRWSIESGTIQRIEKGETLWNREEQMPFTDQTLYCRDCNQAFTFTAGEQEFYESKGLTSAPTRCPDCRAARRQSGGGQWGSSGGRSGGGREREQRQMYTATCAGCGNEAQVPFQPRDGRPIYCSDCYQSQNAGRSLDRRSRW